MEQTDFTLHYDGGYILNPLTHRGWAWVYDNLPPHLIPMRTQAILIPGRIGPMLLKIKGEGLRIRVS